MTSGLTALSVRRPIGVAVLCVAVCILGWISVSRLPVDLLPEVDFPRISIVRSPRRSHPSKVRTVRCRPSSATW
jgi:HAE1 family hydrophobic/amphiphilic exporter-1